MVIAHTVKGWRLRNARRWSSDGAPGVTLYRRRRVDGRAWLTGAGASTSSSSSLLPPPPLRLANSTNTVTAANTRASTNVYVHHGGGSDDGMAVAARCGGGRAGSVRVRRAAPVTSADESLCIHRHVSTARQPALMWR